jgi:signal transduction histidine kinase
MTDKLPATLFNLGVRLRLLLLLAALALMAALTAWGVTTAWRQISELEGRLTEGHLETFRLADHFQQGVLSLNASILRFTALRENGTWEDFERAGKQLDHWIDEQNPKLNTDRERVLMQQLNDAYDDYLRAARGVHSNQQPATVSASSFSQLAEFERQAQRLLQLGIQLADAHREAQESFLERANTSLDHLRVMLYVGVGLLLALAAGLAIVLHRDFIAPLQVKLVHSAALLERQEKLASLGMLAAGIAHEIRNPLTSIKARLYTLGKHIRGNQAGSADAGLISAEIDRLERIVQDVLQFAKPAEPRSEVVPASAPLRDVQLLMAPALEKQRVRLTVENSPSLYVSVDTALIKQVLINLIRNAADAIGSDGLITLRVRRDRVNIAGRPADVAILEVTDNGQGMTTEVQERLFDPFFSTKESGTGLGLPIAARIVEKHGGALLYQTRSGHGTTFGIVLPLVPAPTKQ